MHMPDQWNIIQIGTGTVQSQAENLCLTVPSASSDSYHDAQITDYHSDTLKFQNQPPLRLTLRARAEGDIHGTAGFGFLESYVRP